MFFYYIKGARRVPHRRGANYTGLSATQKEKTADHTELTCFLVGTNRRPCKHVSRIWETRSSANDPSKWHWEQQWYCTARGAIYQRDHPRGSIKNPKTTCGTGLQEWSLKWELFPRVWLTVLLNSKAPKIAAINGPLDFAFLFFFSHPMGALPGALLFFPLGRFLFFLLISTRSIYTQEH